jgi:hypothetical protein
MNISHAFYSTLSGLLTLVRFSTMDVTMAIGIENLRFSPLSPASYHGRYHGYWN